MNNVKKAAALLLALARPHHFDRRKCGFSDFVYGSRLSARISGRWVCGLRQQCCNYQHGQNRQHSRDQGGRSTGHI